MHLASARQCLRQPGPLLAVVLTVNMLWLSVAASASFAACPHHFGVFYDHQHQPNQGHAELGGPAADYFAQLTAAPLCSSLPGQNSATSQDSTQPCSCGDLSCVLTKASAPVSMAPLLPIWPPQINEQAPLCLQTVKILHPFERHPPSLAPPVA